MTCMAREKEKRSWVEVVVVDCNCRGTVFGSGELSWGG